MNSSDDPAAVIAVHGDREYLVRPGEDLETDLGVLEIPESPAVGERLETHLGEPFALRPLRGPDLFHHLERTGAPMVPRDIGLVMGETGIQTGDRVLDVGTGTGVLATALARAGATVLTYERNEEAATVARENLGIAGVSGRVTVRTGDARDDIDRIATDPVDVMTLDTGDASDLVTNAPEVVIDGGFVAAYSPFIETARSVNEAAHKADLTDIRTTETIQREMTFDDRGSRPTTAPVGHTGYLTVARVGQPPGQ